MLRQSVVSAKFFILAVVLLCMGSFSYASVAKASTLEELQVMIATLMAQIAALQGGVTPTPVVSGAITSGSEVKTAAILRVRATAAGTILGLQSQGQIGTVLAGTVVVDGVRWYQVDFAAGLDGWVAGLWLTKSSTELVDVQTFIRTNSGEHNKMEPGLQDASIATISVLPDSADRYANKVVLQFTPAEANNGEVPWTAFKKISLWTHGWNILSVNAADASQWHKVGNAYQITVFTGNQKIAANRSYEFTVAVTSNGTAQVGDRWNVVVPAKGVIIWSKAHSHMTNATAMTTYPIEFVGQPTTSAGIITSFTATSALVSAARNGTQEVVLTWTAKGTGLCNISEYVEGNEPIKLISGLKPTGTFTVKPVWTTGALAIEKHYILRCARAVEGTDIVVKLQSATTAEYDLMMYSPSNGRTFKIGDTIVMEWKTQNLLSEVANITLFGNNTERHILTNVAVNKGTATYKIPATDSLGKIMSGEYDLTIWITNIKDGDPKGVKSSVKIKIDASTNSTAGTVLGASTDIYAEIAKTLSGIQTSLAALK